MHRPKARPSCWTDAATPRPWLAADLLRVAKGEPPIDSTVVCRTWADERQLKELQGDVCDGCARLPPTIWTGKRPSP